MKQKKVAQRHTNQHHVIPQSRLNGKTVILPIVCHNSYHRLFSNMTPPEIVEWLNKEYWGGWYEIAIKEKGV